MSTHRVVHTATPASHAYCLSLLRRHDHENYLAHLLHPRTPSQTVHLATRALNIELVNIRATVSNEDLAHLRLSFLRSSLDSTLRGTPPATPIFDLLASASNHTSLTPLYTLLDARAAELSYPSVSTLSSLETHARNTHGTLLTLHAASLGLSDPVLTSDAGVSIGLAVLLRGVPAAATNRLSYMPSDLIRDTGAEQQDVLRSSDAGRQVFQRVAQKAEACLAESKARVASSDRRVRHAFWPLLMAEQYLARLRRAGYDPFDDRLQAGLRGTYALWLQMRLLWARLSGR